MSLARSPSTMVAMLALLASGGCAEIPDRLEAGADAAREFAGAHPLVAGTALAAARVALRKPQRLQRVQSPLRDHFTASLGSAAARPGGRQELSCRV